MLLGKPILVGCDMLSGGVLGHRVASNGGHAKWAIKKVSGDIDKCGYAGSRLRIQWDQDAPIKDAMQKVIEGRQAITAPEHSPVGDSQSNGMAGNASKSLAGQIRTLKCHLEAKTQTMIIADHVIFGWMVAWAAHLITRFTTDTDGKSHYFRIKRRRSSQARASFGECVHYMPLKCSGETRAKFGNEPLRGIWLGLNLRTEEKLIGTSEGVVKARIVLSRPADEAWSAKDVVEMVGTPRNSCSWKTLRPCPHRRTHATRVHGCSGRRRQRRKHR